MNRLFSLIFFFSFVALLSTSCGPQTDTGSFVTLLGTDTLAVERFTRTAERMDAEVLIRTPTTVLTRYTLFLDEQGLMTRYESTRHEPLAAEGAPPLQKDVVTVQGDSLIVETTQEGEIQTDTIAGHAAVLPFLDMIHWPFELMLMRAHESSSDSLSQDLFAGRRSLAFVVQKTGPNEMSVTHPFRGTMQTRVDADGRLLELDASATTRKLTVKRVPSVDIERLSRVFAERDVEGHPFGALSTRGRFTGVVHGAQITVDYGQPSKRGREVFGALVPWNEVWRTGANQATHLTTDRDLVIGELDVPAGTYTLYTIPTPTGGTLIINRQTGQNGTTYNEDQDLGRVDMQITALPQTVELFTILAAEAGSEGRLQLLWDKTALSVPFTVE